MKYLKHKLHSLLSDNKFSEILTGSVWSLGASAMSIGFAMIAGIVVVRIYGAEMMGILAVINSFLSLVTIFTVLGTETSILRLIPQHIVKYSYTSAFNLYHKTEYMVIGVSMISAIVFFICADPLAEHLFSKPHLSIYFALAAPFVLFNSLALLNTHAVRGIKLIKVFALMQVLPQTCNLALLLLLGLISKEKNIPLYAMLASTAITAIISCLVVEIAFRKRIAPHDRVKDENYKEILSLSVPMLTTATMSFLMAQSGIILLGVFRSEAEVGYYSIALKLAALIVFVLQAMNTIAAPKFSELFYSGKIDELFYVAHKSAKLIFWAATPVLFGLVLMGGPILRNFFGQEFIAAYPALFFLSIGQFVNAASGSSGYFMNMTGSHQMFRNLICCSAGISICLGFLIIPGYGPTGAAISAMVSLSFLNIAALIYIQSRYGHTTGYFPFSGKFLKAYNYLRHPQY